LEDGIGRLDFSSSIRSHAEVKWNSLGSRRGCYKSPLSFFT